MLFKSYALIVDEEYPTLSVIKKIHKPGKRRIPFGECVYEIQTEIKEDRFLLISVDYDDLKYRDTVYNLATQSERKNPKARTEIEFKQQLFACYDIQKKEFYISNAQKKCAVRILFNEALGTHIKTTIRERLSSVDEFAEAVTAITKVKYTQTRNLVNEAPDSVFAQRYDPLALEVPDRLVSTLEYKNKIDARPVISRLKELVDKQKTKEIESIEIIGVDAEGFEQMFNLDNIVKGINIDIKQDDDGRYDADNVFFRLMAVLKG